MADLYFSISLMILLSGAALGLGAWIAHHASRPWLLLSELMVCSLMLAYMAFVWDRPLLVRLLPFSSAIILGNWLPIFACFYVGVCTRTPSVHLARRIGLAVVTCGLSVFSLIRPVPGDPPRCFSLQPGRALQFQTTDETCSPASAASLLRLHGISTNEAEMARLCLTRTGTHWLGLYRGLKIKLEGTAWDVVAEEFALDIPAQQKGTTTPVTYATTPAVLSLSFSSRRGSSSIATGDATSSSLTGAAGHSVVLLETSSDGILSVFDPSPEYGFEAWPPEFLSDASRGVLLRLVPRQTSTKTSLRCSSHTPTCFDLQEVLRSEYKMRPFQLR